MAADEKFVCRRKPTADSPPSVPIRWSARTAKSTARLLDCSGERSHRRPKRDEAPSPGMRPGPRPLLWSSTDGQVSQSNRRHQAQPSQDRGRHQPRGVSPIGRCMPGGEPDSIRTGRVVDQSLPVRLCGVRPRAGHQFRFRCLFRIGKPGRRIHPGKRYRRLVVPTLRVMSTAPAAAGVAPIRPESAVGSPAGQGTRPTRRAGVHLEDPTVAWPITVLRMMAVMTPRPASRPGRGVVVSAGQGRGRDEARSRRNRDPAPDRDRARCRGQGVRRQSRQTMRAP